MRLYNYNIHFRFLDEEFRGFSCRIQLDDQKIDTKK